MTLFELFLEHGNPSEKYTDEMLAVFLAEVDKTGDFFHEMSVLPKDKRECVIRLLDDRTSRSLSHQAIGEIFCKQLKEKVRAYLQRQYDGLREDVDAYNRQAAKDAVADRAVDEAKQDWPSGSMP